MESKGGEKKRQDATIVIPRAPDGPVSDDYHIWEPLTTEQLRRRLHEARADAEEAESIVTEIVRELARRGETEGA